MSPDIEELLQVIGDPEFGYLELNALERRRASAQSLAARFESTPRRPSLVLNAHRAPWIVGVSSSGKAGATTFAATITAAFEQGGHRTVAVEIDPSGTLEHQFLGARERRQRSHSLRVSAEPMTFSPTEDTFGAGFGASGAGRGDPARPEPRPRRRAPSWVRQREEEKTVELEPGIDDATPLRRRLRAMQCDLAVLDLSAMVPETAPEGLADCDELLLVIRAEVSALHVVTRWDERCAAIGAPFPHVVVNRYDNRRVVERESLAALRVLLGDRLLPLVVPADAAVSDATDRGQLALQVAPDSQAVNELQALADWLLARSERANRVDDLPTSPPG